MNSVFIYCFACLLLAFTVQCGPGRNKKDRTPADSVNNSFDTWNQTIRGGFSGQTVLRFDSTRLDSFLMVYSAFKKYEEDIRTFYRKREYAYAWFDDDGLIEQAGNLADRMMNLDGEGLQREIPHKEALDSLINVYHHVEEEVPQAGRLELMLTAQYFAFAQLAWEGMDEKVSKANDWFVPRKKISYEAYLDSIIAGTAQTSAPVYRQYEELRKFLPVFQKLDSTGAWPAISMEKNVKSYKYADSSAIMPLLRQRLDILGDYKGDPESHRYDSVLFAAVQQFQERHGLAADGVIGPGTLAELNVSPRQRVRQLIVNMERCRWLPARMDREYLGVNIPEFKLHVYHADSLLWSCNVVVGKSVHKTVIFAGNVKYVVFSPYWNVPPSIVRNEIVPAMNRNPNYISRQNMEITGHSGGLPVVRQKPGPRNSLGLVKFLFPNSHNIYLHDTPSKSLFDEPSRAFSHGCIRVSEPVKLARFLLKDDPAWDDESIHKAMKAGKERSVTLDDPVPVFIAYFTAFVDRSGRINFRKDIYKRDERLAQTLLAADKS